MASKSLFFGLLALIFIFLLGIGTINATPNITFILPTPDNNSFICQNHTEINISIAEPNLNTFKFNWNTTNYFFYDDSLVLGMNFNNNSYEDYTQDCSGTCNCSQATTQTVCAAHSGCSWLVEVCTGGSSCACDSSTEALCKGDNMACNWGSTGDIVYDYSKYGNNGTTYGDIKYNATAGKYGGAFKFDGVNDYVNCGNGASLNGMSQLTLEAWINYLALPANYYALTGKEIQYRFALKSNGKINFVVATANNGWCTSGTYTSDVSLSPGWHHIVGVYDGTIVKLYIDGVYAAQGSQNISGNITTTQNIFGIGHQVGNGNYFNGTIDEVRIYNKALSAAEIQMSYYSNLQKFNSTQYYFYSNITNLTNGEYTYYGWANDTAGNSNNTETRTLTVDTTKPSVVWVLPANNTNSSDPTPLLKFNLTDSILQTIGFKIYVFNKTTGILVATETGSGTNGTTTEYTLIHQLQLYGNPTPYTFIIEATDTCGYKTNSTNLTYNLVPPVVYLTSPTTNQIFSGDTTLINFTFNVTDPSFSTVANCSLYVNDIYKDIKYNVPTETPTTFQDVAVSGTGAYNWTVNCIDDNLANGNDTNYFSIACYNWDGAGTCTAKTGANCNCLTQALNDNTNCYKEVKMNSSITNWVGNCINNPANFTNKTFDCQGFTIDGDDSGTDQGIYLKGKTGNTIKNCIATGFSYGIYLHSSTNNTLTNNTANSNIYYGIYLSFSSNNNTLINNTANSNIQGILLYSSTNNNTLISNTANSNTQNGIYLLSSSNNNIINNTVNNNTQTGIYLNNAGNNNITSNAVKFNKQHGFYTLSTSTGNILNTNTFCSNNQNLSSYVDIYDADSNTGNNNTCQTTYNYNDTGKTGCAYLCILDEFVKNFTAETPTENIYVDSYTQITTRTNETIEAKTQAKYNIPYNITLVNISTIIVRNNQSQNINYTLNGNNITFNISGTNSSYYDIFYDVLFAKEITNFTCPSGWTNYNTYCYGEYYYGGSQYKRYFERQINITTNITALNYPIFYNVSTNQFFGWDAVKNDFKLFYNSSATNVSYNINQNPATFVCGNNHTNGNYSLFEGIAKINIQYWNPASSTSSGGGYNQPTTEQKIVVSPTIIQQNTTTAFSFKYNITNPTNAETKVRIVVLPLQYSSYLLFNGQTASNIGVIYLSAGQTINYNVSVLEGICNSKDACEKL
ncbi:MAG: hypothetical protein CVU81_00505, partial [Euryarchaeota archaeon HGW-Euryarchaeota-1]